jgi:hypothetical protein
MSIDFRIYEVLRSSGAKCLVGPTHLTTQCAPLERQTEVARKVYKHLAPLEPDSGKQAWSTP